MHDLKLNDFEAQKYLQAGIVKFLEELNKK